MAKLKITSSGTYTVSNGMKAEIKTTAPVDATLVGNGAPITKLKLDFENMPAGSTFNIDFSTMTGGPTVIDIKGYNAVDQIAFNGATLTGVNPANPSQMQFTYVGADGATYTGVFQLKGKGNTNWNTNPLIICFAAGTLIDTPAGPRPIETLRAGDAVRCWTGEVEPVRWIGHRHLGPVALAAQPSLRPVRLFAGALGPGKPDRPMLVSRQHRLMVADPRVEVMFACPAALVPALALADGRRGEVALDVEEVTYFHILLGRHAVLRANNAPAESLWLGDQAIEALSDDQREEIARIFPSLFEADASAGAATDTATGASGAVTTGTVTGICTHELAAEMMLKTWEAAALMSFLA